MFSRHSRITGLAILLALFVAGCGAPRPVKYYVLDVNPAPATSLNPQFPVSLLVSRVVASQLYRDDRLVYGSGPVQLGTYDYDRWAQPPADMVQDTLVAALRSTGQYRSVSRVTSSVRGDYILRSRLLAMYGVDQPALMARFTIQFELYDPANRSIVWSHSYTHDEPVQGKNVPDIVLAMDGNVKSCMQEVTASLAQYFTANPPKPGVE
ncbi:MAG: ABC-type transport auxiliary lipoprotein family protein [Candidatus Acidiferrales bacterium]